ncbi:MAG: DUF1415 domain-containing protein [Proteobacteria bacterium]|nr:DUF1415 domain-containing protein [Pseudomonadota bacterium]
MSEPPIPSDADIIAAMRHWVDKAVIGLNLCPFAKAVQVKGQVRYVVSHAPTAEALLTDLKAELELLQATPPEQIDNTLLIHPKVLGEFLDFQAFLPRTNAVLKKARLVGEIQIASFHPQYQFADSEPDALSNYTNRAPYPTQHLLREASIARAVEAYPTDTIYERNIETLDQLGQAGWDKLGIRPAPPAEPSQSAP